VSGLDAVSTIARAAARNEGQSICEPFTDHRSISAVAESTKTISAARLEA
jgi:hypothetical protein